MHFPADGVARAGKVQRVAGNEIPCGIAIMIAAINSPDDRGVRQGYGIARGGFAFKIGTAAVNIFRYLASRQRDRVAYGSTAAAAVNTSFYRAVRQRGMVFDGGGALGKSAGNISCRAAVFHQEEIVRHGCCISVRNKAAIRYVYVRCAVKDQGKAVDVFDVVFLRRFSAGYVPENFNSVPVACDGQRFVRCYLADVGRHCARYLGLVVPFDCDLLVGVVNINFVRFLLTRLGDSARHPQRDAKRQRGVFFCANTGGGQGISYSAKRIYPPNVCLFSVYSFRHKKNSFHITARRKRRHKHYFPSIRH